MQEIIMQSEGAITHEAGVTTKNLSLVFLLRVAQYPFLLLFLMLIPRIMGLEIYGKYALLISISAITISLLDLGVREIYARFIPEFEVAETTAAIRRLYMHVLALKLVVDVLASGILYSLLYILYGDRFPAIYFLIIVAIHFVTDIGGVPYNLLFGLNELGKYSLRDPLRRALSLILVLVLFNYFGLIGAIFSTLLVEGVLTVLYFYCARRYFRAEFFHLNIPFLMPFLRFGFISYISWMIMNIWQRLGNSLIEFMTKDSTEVALFDMPNQLLILTFYLTLFLVTSLVPVFTKLLLTGKEDKILIWSSLMMKYVGILCSMIFGAFILMGAYLIPYVIGPEYKDIFPNAVVLLLAMFPMAFGQLGFVFSMVYKKLIRYLQALVVSLAVFLALSLILIPQYRSMGCAIASVISTFVLAVITAIVYREKILPALVEGLKVMALGLICVPFLFLRGGILVNISLVACSMLTYAFLLISLKVVKIDELSNILRAVRNQPEAAKC